MEFLNEGNNLEISRQLAVRISEFDMLYFYSVPKCHNLSKICAKK